MLVGTGISGSIANPYISLSSSLTTSINGLVVIDGY